MQRGPHVLWTYDSIVDVICAKSLRSSYMGMTREGAAVERIWHTQGSQGRILALACRSKSLTRFELFHLRSGAVQGYLTYKEMHPPRTLP